MYETIRCYKRALNRAFFIFFVAALPAFAAASGAKGVNAEDALRVRYLDAPADPVYIEGTQYLVAVLKLALDHADVEYTLEAVHSPAMPSSRALVFLQNGRFSIGWAHTNAEREQNLRPIRIPLYRGLVGWRMFFIRERDLAHYGSVKRMNELKLLRAGQGHDWPDTKILEQHGFNVRTGLSRDSLFQLLRYGRIDYFPRGIYEILVEQSVLETQGLVVEENLVLHYPSAYYFFTTKENELLASTVERGLEQAIKNGEFFGLFIKHFGPAIRAANLQNREIFEISNPTLSKQTPLDREELWFHPHELELYSKKRRFAQVPAD